MVHYVIPTPPTDDHVISDANLPISTRERVAAGIGGTCDWFYGERAITF